MTQRTPSKRRPRQDPSAPSLKQRAADLRASMPARSLKASAPPSPQAAPDADAVLVAAAADLQRLEAAIAAIPSSPGRSLDEAPGYADLDAQVERVTGILANTPAVGLPGLHAKAKAFLSDRFSVQSPEELEMAQSLARDVLGASPTILPPRPHDAPVEESDPVFVLIEAHHAAFCVWDTADAAVGNTHPSDPSLQEARKATIPLLHAEENAFMALVGSQPTSLSGLMALADYLPAALALRGAHEADDEAALALGSICASIRALVAKSRVTAATGAAPTDWHKPPPGFMASPAVEPTHFVLIPHALRVELDRLHVIALHEFDRQVRPDTTPARRERLRRLLKIDIFEAASLSGDAEILALGMELDAAHARWRASLPAYNEAQARFSWAEHDAKARGEDAWVAHEAVWDEPGVREAMGLFEDICAELDPLCRKIWRTPARTPLGLAVKARASLVMIFACGEYEAGQALGEDEDLNEQSARHLIEACCAFAGVNWKGELADDTTLAVPPAAPVERTYGLVEQINLPAASVDELRTIHDRTQSLSGIAYDMSCQAACRSGNRHPLADPFNAAGRFLHWLGDALTDVESRAADELQDRQPSGLWDRRTRLAAIAERVINNGDEEDTASFVRDLLIVTAEQAGR